MELRLSCNNPSILDMLPLSLSEYQRFPIIVVYQMTRYSISRYLAALQVPSCIMIIFSTSLLRSGCDISGRRRVPRLLHSSVFGGCRSVSVLWHHSDVMMRVRGSQIIGVLMFCPTLYSSADQRKHESSASPAFVRGIHRWQIDSPHKVTRKCFHLMTSSWYMAYNWPVLLTVWLSNANID